MLGQGADAQLHGFQFVEVLDDFICRNADKARCESTLRDKGCFRTFGQFPHLICHCDIFCQVEVMHVFLPCNICDRDIAKIGQAGNHGDGSVLLNVRAKTRRIGGIKRKGVKISMPVSLDHLICRTCFLVGELHMVVAAVGE